MYQQARGIERRDDPERDDPRPADGEGHGKPGKDTAEETDKDDDQADFDPVETK